MLKIIGVEAIAALAILLWYEVLCVREKLKGAVDDKRRADEGPLA